MWDFQIGRITGALLKTLPFLIFRLMIYLLVAVGFLIVIGVGSTVGYLISSIWGESGSGAFIGGIIGLGLSAAVMYWLREYILYLVKAGHIAVLVEVLEGKALPGGKGQIDYAQSKVRERFVEASLLFGLDRLLKGILRMINRMLSNIADFLPIPGLESLVGIFNKVLTLSLNYTDEIIIAYNFKVRSTNAWATSKDAVILYAQNYKTMLKNAFFLGVVLLIATIIIFLVVLGPVVAVFSFFPGYSALLAFIVALIVAWCLKAALLEPFAVAAMMQVFFKTVEGQLPNEEWDQRLSSMSKKFRQLKDKAAGASEPAAG